MKTEQKAILALAGIIAIAVSVAAGYSSGVNAMRVERDNAIDARIEHAEQVARSLSEVIIETAGRVERVESELGISWGNGPDNTPLADVDPLQFNPL